MTATAPTSPTDRHRSFGAYLLGLCVEACDGLEGDARRAARAHAATAYLALPDDGGEAEEAALTDNFR